MLTEQQQTARRDLRGPRPKTRRLLRTRVLLGLVGAGLIFTFGSLAMLVVACLTLFQARRFYAEVMAKWMSRWGLWCCGVRFVEHRNFTFSKEQTVFISNHTSTLDMFVLIALGLPRTRYFLSGFLRTLLPLAFVGYLIGVFWTSLQKYPQKRTRLFQRAERVLRQTGDSVFLTPEGQQIGCFNKGAFHLATNLSAPIQPIFIRIPTEVDPGPWSHSKSFDMRPGTIDVYYKPVIDTSKWRLEDLESNRDDVRQLYADWQAELEAGIPDTSNGPPTAGRSA